MTPAMRAAVESGRHIGLTISDPVLVQETNNTVVWLYPEPVIAKVATRREAAEDLQLEHAIAVELFGLDAEIAAPLRGAIPTVHETTGYVVTLWERLVEEPQLQVPEAELAGSLIRLHAALAHTLAVVPSFRLALWRARTALDDDTFMVALSTDDRQFLRRVFDASLRELDQRSFEERRLHGEPHDGNRISTAAGIRWIDFESCCVGPLEWDLAFLPPELDAHFRDVDRELIELLRRLNSARVATWCWGRVGFAGLRRHGEHHLAILRALAGDGP